MMMTSSYSNSMVIFDHTMASGDSREVIPSRFGEITIDTRNALHFPKGMLGMPQVQRFALANFPSPRMQQFKLLQSLDDLALSFITLPLSIDNAIIRRDHCIAVCEELAMRPEGALILLVVCVHRSPEGTRLSVNARAPVFIDAERRMGGQYVFTHDAYKVQHFIS